MDSNKGSAQILSHKPSATESDLIQVRTSKEAAEAAETAEEALAAEGDNIEMADQDEKETDTKTT